ncbi:3-oxoadipate enol-lactonase [Histidinibacterium lentulum]|uniref:3-oxoadipate enol-lactonase n=1 Tax=Histidinibacterium lentulum TaxID=2480588 RepID=A0A3N2R9U4_9RHOB|nr:3-oxoadipate enol-lactonase [Histidinibacterium lentulum]ROU04239.1 3-oxoadipate enol-lactonase [Histidinibacterium lentulum]
MTDRRVDRGGWSLAAVESGQAPGAPVVVMSNSLGATRAMWDDQADWLGRTARVIRYDTRGHGASDTPPGPYSFDDLVDDVLAVMDAFGVGRAAYVGLSLGGMTGLGLGLRAPERLTRLVVAAARADAPPPFVQSWDDRVAKIREGGMAAIWPGTLERWLTPGFQEAEPEAAEALRAQFLETTVDGYAGCAAALQGLDYLRHLGNLTIPTLYVAGAEDMGAPASAMESMAAATPDARYVCVADAAHIVNLDGRAAFDAALRDFLEL